MKEKFSDYESVGFLSKEGKFVFTIKSAELKESKSGDPMWVFEAESEQGKTTIYHSLAPKARWSFNNLIAACFRLSKEEKKTLELDYEEVGQELVGKTFVGVVEEDCYEKAVKVPQDDGTFKDDIEVRVSYKITSYEME